MPLVMIQSDPRARLRPCLRCGYSLRNVPDARVCPECGLPVWLTLSGNDDLELSNPQWLARLAVACGALAAAHVMLSLGVLAMHAWMLLAAEDAANFYDYLAFVPFVAGAYLVACGIGLLLLGSDEGRVPERARIWRRAATIVGPITIVTGLWIAAPHYGPRPPRALVLSLAAGQAIVGWVYLQHLALRIPSRRVSEFARSLWIAVAVALLSVLLRGWAWLQWIAVIPWSKHVLGWTLFLLLYPPLAAVLFVRFARTFRHASRGAQKSWDTPQ